MVKAFPDKFDRQIILELAQPLLNYMQNNGFEEIVLRVQNGRKKA